MQKKSLALLVAAALGGGLAQAAGTGSLFISSEKDSNITVLDGETYEIVKQIGTAARPRHLQFSPDRSRIYVAAGDGNAIDIIDVDKLELVDRIEGIDDPEAFDFSPDGKIMYLSLEDDAKLGILILDEFFAARENPPDLSIAEAAPAGESGDDDDDDDADDEHDENADDSETLAGLSTIEVGAEPEGILVSPDGSTVYVASEVANMVHVVDTASGELSANVVVGNRPRRFALTADKKQLWISNELSGSVTIMDTATNEIVDTITFLPPGFRPADVTPVGITLTADGSTAIVALGRANHIAFVNVASREIEDYVLVGSRAWNTTLTRDNELLYVVNGLSDDISVVDVERRRVSKSIPVGRVPYAVLIDD